MLAGSAIEFGKQLSGGSEESRTLARGSKGLELKEKYA